MKCELALAKGKQDWDKRETERKREADKRRSRRLRGASGDRPFGHQQATLVARAEARGRLPERVTIAHGNQAEF